MADTGHNLSGIRYEGGSDHTSDSVAILVSKWNSTITHVLRDGAIATLKAAGIPPENILIREVPGAYELPAAAQFVLESKPRIHAVICLGVVIQGETRHFDFICESVGQGIREVGMKHSKPVIFGVLTPNTKQQALDRAGGKYGNKGEEAAVAALEMIDFQRSLYG
ncbi:MAG TPA: 6,7-dimethyl-8-ribityllumazine synthase [Bacteroidetes bacterium]|nr:6,7-dimethyl-8-ribityllumazine synthase [Bacteroidota bacterium]